MSKKHYRFSAKPNQLVCSVQYMISHYECARCGRRYAILEDATKLCRAVNINSLFVKELDEKE